MAADEDTLWLAGPRNVDPDQLRRENNGLCCDVGVSWQSDHLFPFLPEATPAASANQGLFSQMAATHPHLFSNVLVFLPAAALEAMQTTVAAIEAVAQIPAFRDAVMAWAPEISKVDPGPAGALMGYDFHLGEDSPKLIEVNTNAGGAFLNAVAGLGAWRQGDVSRRQADQIGLGRYFGG